MTTGNQPVAFQLGTDQTQIIDDCWPARLVKFENSQNAISLHPAEELDIPDRVQFESMFSVIKKNDFPANKNNWPLMSRRMLDVLLSVGDFKHRVIDVQMFDDTILKDEERFDADGNPIPEAVDERFVAVQLLEHIDAIDLENSKYSVRETSFTTRPIMIFSKLILKVPDHEGSADPSTENPIADATSKSLPPLFRLLNHRRNLYVSAAARQALDEANIVGPIYEPVMGS